METVTLRGEDFKIIHNTLCDLRNLVSRMEQSMIKTSEFDRIEIEPFNRVIEGFEMGLKNAYDQDENGFDRKMDYYREFQRQNRLGTIWSIYDLPAHGFLSDHPFPSDSFVVYHGHHVPVSGPTWGDVYRAADRCIELSGDEHHIFIEHFEQVGNELRLVTGS